MTRMIMGYWYQYQYGNWEIFVRIRIIFIHLAIIRIKLLGYLMVDIWFSMFLRIWYFQFHGNMINQYMTIMGNNNFTCICCKHYDHTSVDSIPLSVAQPSHGVYLDIFVGMYLVIWRIYVGDFCWKCWVQVVVEGGFTMNVNVRLNLEK